MLLSAVFEVLKRNRRFVATVPEGQLREAGHIKPSLDTIKNEIMDSEYLGEADKQEIIRNL